MKKTLFVFLILLTSLVAKAEDPRPKFDPQQFQAAMEQFIVKEACLTPQQSAIFFPVYREMQEKQRALFTQMRRSRHIDTRDDKACKEAIKKQDDLDIQMKELQQRYHNKFMQILPAGKVMEIIKAEDRFHRQAFRKAVKKN